MGGELAGVAGPDAAWLRTPVDVRHEDRRISAEFEVGAGDRVPFVLTYQASRTSRRPKPVDADDALRDTETLLARLDRPLRLHRALGRGRARGR